MTTETERALAAAVNKLTIKLANKRADEREAPATAAWLKGWMLDSIAAMRAGKTVFSDGLNVTDKDLFLIEHFVRQFPVSRKRKEVRKNEDADDQADVQHGPDGLVDAGG